MTMPAIFDHHSLRCIGGGTYASPECVAEEIPVALVYNDISHAVMMATPQDLDDFALGFSLTERILHQPDELLESAQRITDAGIELSLTITNERFCELRARRRNLVGRTGCGLCGVDSLGEALRP